jgi:uncharacterized damage-inducible protein DinB
MKNQSPLKNLLLEQFEGRNAHIDFTKAIEGLKLNDVGTRPEKLPHSIWELAQHIRLAQFDILDFSRNPDYQALSWPDDYWPASSQPENQQQWDEMIAAFNRDHQAMADLIHKKEDELLNPLPHGDGQTLFREALLIVDHTAYHIGQIVQVRRLLGLWK